MRKMESNSILKNKRKIVEEPIKEKEMWIFADKKVVFTWNSFFQAFQDKMFQVLREDDPSTELRKGIYKNIIKYGLHWEATRTLVLPCPNVIEWIT